MDTIKKCKHCGGEFDLPGKVFSNHVRWCEENPARLRTEKIKQGVNESYDQKLGRKKRFAVVCVKCGKKFSVVEREKYFPSKNNYFCNRACANSRKKSEESKEKARRALLLPRENRPCLQCNKTFPVLPKNKQTYCSRKCQGEARKTADEQTRYWRDCAFKFSIYNYPDEFDLKLIREYGWYKAPNRGNNPTGVSRDHMISIKFGWENGISSEVIAHPANCKLMQQTENHRKRTACSKKLNQLLKEIKSWDNKYGSLV